MRVKRTVPRRMMSKHITLFYVLYLSIALASQNQASAGGNVTFASTAAVSVSFRFWFRLGFTIPLDCGTYCPFLLNNYNRLVVTSYTKNPVHTMLKLPQKSFYIVFCVLFICYSNHVDSNRLDDAETCWFRLRVRFTRMIGKLHKNIKGINL